MAQRIRPHHLVIGLGVVFALYSIASGAVP
ncbi:MAG: hypothetical protein QOH64_1947, partial [Acidimicrobiaceae bacterium]